jgi:hypothetical protein
MAGAGGMIALGSNSGRGKSELRRAVWFLTRTGSNPRESATENIPSALKVDKGEKVR